MTDCVQRRPTDVVTRGEEKTPKREVNRTLQEGKLDVDWIEGKLSGPSEETTTPNPYPRDDTFSVVLGVPGTIGVDPVVVGGPVDWDVCSGRHVNCPKLECRSLLVISNRLSRVSKLPVGPG